MRSDGIPRVLMFCEQFHPIMGGRERQAQLLAARLVEQGTEVEVLTFRRDPAWPKTEVLQGGVRVQRIPDVDFNVRVPRARRLGLGLATVLLRIIRTVIAMHAVASRTDVVHAHNVSSPYAAVALRCAKSRGLGVVATPINMAEWFDLRVLSNYPRLGKQCVRWLVADVDRWVAISGEVRRECELAGIPQGRIVCIPNGVSIPELPRLLRSTASRFLHLGRLATTAPRDTLGLIEAFEAVFRVKPAAELALVGGGDRLGSVRQAAAISSARRQIAIPGPQDGDRWRHWAHCLVQPSFREGMSNALLEGMAAGLACVAYDIPPNREALDDGRAGLLVPVGDREALARVLVELATKEGTAPAWGRLARARAQNAYDIQDVAHRTQQLYGAVANEARRGGGR